MRLAVTIGLALLACGSFYLFVVRYWLHRDCIEAAQSSCARANGDNLTSGGILWGLLALVFAGIALSRLLRR